MRHTAAVGQHLLSAAYGFVCRQAPDGSYRTGTVADATLQFARRPVRTGRVLRRFGERLQERFHPLPRILQRAAHGKVQRYGRGSVHTRHGTVYRADTRPLPRARHIIQHQHHNRLNALPQGGQLALQRRLPVPPRRYGRHVREDTRDARRTEMLGTLGRLAHTDIRYRLRTHRNRNLLRRGIPRTLAPDGRRRNENTLRSVHDRHAERLLTRSCLRPGTCH